VTAYDTVFLHLHRQVSNKKKEDVYRVLMRTTIPRRCPDSANHDDPTLCLTPTRREYHTNKYLVDICATGSVADGWPLNQFWKGRGRLCSLSAGLPLRQYADNSNSPCEAVLVLVCLISPRPLGRDSKIMSSA